jgi:hypothetical protein
MARAWVEQEPRFKEAYVVLFCKMIIYVNIYYN